VKLLNIPAHTQVTQTKEQLATTQSYTMYDVIIVGGGISGLYTAWRLGTATTLKVLVLEADERFGGRYLSCMMPGGYVADLGAMR